MTVEKGVVLAVMAVLSLIDIKKKLVNMTLLIPFGVIALSWQLFQGTEIAELLTGLLPGGVCLLLSYVTKESIGKGDGLVLCVLGLLCGCKATFAMLGIALFFSAVWAIFLLALRRAGRKTELPFLPCLSLGYLFYVVL